jgi:predicted esterase
MIWKQSSRGFRFDPIAKGSPEALVLLLDDLGTGVSRLIPVAARWAASVPTTAFIALKAIEQFAALSSDGSAEPAVLDRAARHLEPLIEQELRDRRLDPSRLVLAGFESGGTLALHMLLQHGWNCAGVLAFGATLMRPLPRTLRVDRKVRLIECVADGRIAQTRLRDSVALLAARGIDARGVLLVGSILSDETIRHGGAYLVELVGTAQRGDRLRLGRESGYGR